MRPGAVLLLCCILGLACRTAAPPTAGTAAAARLEDFAGNYQLAADRVLSLGPLSEAGGRLVFFDSKTRRYGVLYPISGRAFVTGTLDENDRLTPADLEVELLTTRAGRVTGLTWREGDAKPVRGTRVSPHRDEQVSFQNGEVTLQGTLTLPASRGPHPAVILLHEAGPRSRPFGIWPSLFAHHGVAMLTYDKRGSGASTGSWQTASFEDLAGDALAALSLLRARPDIDPGQVGLWSNSNSGWIVPLVAARSDAVAFIISRVGSTLPPTENVLYEIESQMRREGFSEEEIAQAAGLRRKLQDAILTDMGWEEFRAAGESARNQRWFPLARVGRYLTAPLPPEPSTLQQWRNPLAFDPLPYWERVTCPVLALYGESDTNTPTARNAPLLKEALERAGNDDFTIVILPGVDHSFYEINTNEGGYVSAIPALQRFVPGYVDRMMSWLLPRVKLPVKAPR